MIRMAFTKIDGFMFNLTISVLIGVGLMLHVLTALTIGSYYGSPWGFVSFLLPAVSEIYLLTLQINAKMYNYMLIIVCFIGVGTVMLAATWLLKNILKSSSQKPV